MTKAELRAAIAGITERLKGPLPNLERALLVADRKDLRMELAIRVAHEKDAEVAS
mgnify:CR=1 FL=1